MFLSQPKLSAAKCRRNVDNFLAACRKIGVREVSDQFEQKQLLQLIFTFACQRSSLWRQTELWGSTFGQLANTFCPPALTQFATLFAPPQLSVHNVKTRTNAACTCLVPDENGRGDGGLTGYPLTGRPASPPPRRHLAPSLTPRHPLTPP